MSDREYHSWLVVVIAGAGLMAGCVLAWVFG